VPSDKVDFLYSRGITRKINGSNPLLIDAHFCREQFRVLTKLRSGLTGGGVVRWENNDLA